MPDPGLLNHLPQQWLGITVLILFILYAVNKVVEESERIAKKLGPLGKKLYDRAQRRHGAAGVSAVIEQAMATRQLQENEAFEAVHRRLARVVALNEVQSVDIADLLLQVRSLTAYTVYDARWHHRAEIVLAGIDGASELPEHLDFLEFQRRFATDPDGTWRDI